MIGTIQRYQSTPYWKLPNPSAAAACCRCCLLLLLLLLACLLSTFSRMGMPSASTFRNGRYNFDVVPVIRDYLIDASARAMGESELYDTSLLREPRAPRPS